MRFWKEGMDMRRNRKKKFAYRPSDKVISRESAASSIMGAVGILGYILLIFGSFRAQGNGGAFYGLAGWGILILSVLGLMFAIKSFQDTAAMAVWKIIGCITNGLVLGFSVVIFILGI